MQQCLFECRFSWILSKCSPCNHLHRLHFYLQKAVPSHLHPRKPLLPVSKLGSANFDLHSFLILLLLCWVNFEISPSRPDCSSVILLSVAISRVYSQHLGVSPRFWNCYPMVALRSLWYLRAVSERSTSSLCCPRLELFNLARIGSLHWYLVWVCFSFLLSDLCLFWGWLWWVPGLLVLNSVLRLWLPELLRLEVTRSFTWWIFACVCGPFTHLFYKGSSIFSALIQLLFDSGAKGIHYVFLVYVFGRKSAHWIFTSVRDFFFFFCSLGIA